MATWRMAMRNAYRGEDMFRQCRPKNLAAITYNPLLRTDLSLYSPENRPPGWDDLAPSQKGSISKFAWQIRAGDQIYVRDSARPNLLVGFGYVLGQKGRLAYVYDDRSPIKTQSGVVWRHLIRVDWEDGFQEIPYKDHSPNTTVLALDVDELSNFRLRSKRAEHKQHGLSDRDVDLAIGLEAAYPRVTPATVRLILPRHVTLSEQFRLWLRKKHSVQGHRERHQIDMEFKLGRDHAMAEFKIAYDGNTKAAIREALGQILEYNHYPGRRVTKSWFLILDRCPTSNDHTFVEALRGSWGCPIYLGWRHNAGFRFYPKSRLS